MEDVSSRLVDERKMENLQLPLSQHFTNARLEQAYRQYNGTNQLGNDVAMTRLMMAYQAVATYKTLKEAHEMDWMTMLMICNFAVLGATLLLPSVWPGVWRRCRDAIMPPLLVSHTVALHIFLYTHLKSEHLLGRGTLSRLIDQGTDVLAVQALVLRRSLTSRLIPAQATGYMMLASYNWHQGHVEVGGLLTSREHRSHDCISCLCMFHTERTDPPNSLNPCPLHAMCPHVTDAGALHAAHCAGVDLTLHHRLASRVQGSLFLPARGGSSRNVMG
ncbi:hypothetical protein ACKKBF_B03770 [Auxenochlorella protothecoides x Auxenochlorella symbiontica]